MRKIPVFIILSLLVPFLARGAEPPRFGITLDQTLRATLATSDLWKSAQSAAEAADDRALAQRGVLMPRLGIAGSYRYLDEIPLVAFAPGAPKVSFTTHNSYSIGPQLTWTPFAGGALFESWRAAQANARAQNQQADAVRRQLRLASRLAYFQAQLASEQVRLLSESLKVEQSQYNDIRVRTRAGDTARVDLLAAEQSLLTRVNLLLQARTNLATAIRELSALTRLGEDLDPTWPTEPGTKFTVGDEMPAPTVVLVLDPLKDSLARMEKPAGGRFDERHPQLEFLADLADAARKTAKSLEGGHWPTLNVLGSVMREYPNGPIKEDITQKTFAVNLNFPLFAGGNTLYAVRAQRKEAESTEERRLQEARDFLKSWNEAHDQVAALKIRQVVSRRAAERAAQVASLRYKAYQAGQLRFLDVQDADLRELQTKVDAAAVDVNLLIQYANLESLSEETKE